MPPSNEKLYFPSSSVVVVATSPVPSYTIIVAPAIGFLSLASTTLPLTFAISEFVVIVTFLAAS